MSSPPLRLKDFKSEFSHPLLEKLYNTLLARGPTIPPDEFDSLVASYATELDVEIEKNIFHQLAYENFVEEELKEPTEPTELPTPPLPFPDFPDYKQILSCLPERLWICYDKDLHNLTEKLYACLLDQNEVNKITKEIAKLENDYNETSTEFVETAFYVLKMCVSCKTNNEWQTLVFTAETRMHRS